MDPNLFVTPIAGGIIGYFTNWLAIKMLFYPHETKYIGKFKVPFTPGLIPKEKQRISSTLGKTVENHLLTNDVILEELSNADVAKNLDTFCDNALNYLKDSDLSVDEMIMKAFDIDDKEILDQKTKELIKVINNPPVTQKIKDKTESIIHTKLREFFRSEIRRFPYEKFVDKTKTLLLDNAIYSKNTASLLLEKTIWEFLISMKDNERKLNQSISSSTAQELKDYISLKTPVFANYIISLTEDEEIENMIKDKISSVIKKTANPLTRIFIDSQSIYVKSIEGLTYYFNDPENVPEIEKAVETCIDRLLETTLGQVAYTLSSQLRENNIKRLVDFVLKESLEEGFVSAFFDNIKSNIKERETQALGTVLYRDQDELESKIINLSSYITNLIFSDLITESISAMAEFKISNVRNQQISSLASALSEHSIAKCKKFTSYAYGEFVKKIAPNLLDSFDIAKVIESRINSFSTAHTEKLIVNLAEKELKAITYVGGVLGFILGLLPVMLNLI